VKEIGVAEEQKASTRLSEVKGEHAISVVLRYGAIVSTLIMAAGVVLAMFRGSLGASSAYRLIHPRDLLPPLLRLEPVAIVETGILLLLFTPIARIVVAVIGFALERDLKYVLISLGVLAIVLLSISFAIEA
jgi:uncharacterized membrane protein